MSEKSLYEVLGVDQRSRQEQVQVAFEEALAVRRARRGRTSDLVAAHLVLSQPALRRAYDLQLFGTEAGERIHDAKSALTEMVKEHAPDVDWAEVGRSAWQTTLKATYLVSGVTAKAADFTGIVSRRVQEEAARRIDRDEV